MLWLSGIKNASEFHQDKLMSRSIHQMVIMGALYFIFSLCSYKEIKKRYHPEYLKARGLRERMWSIWELFLCKGGNRQSRPSLLVGKKKKAVGGEGNKKKKKITYSSTNFALYKAFSLPWVTVNPPRVLNNEFHFTQG